MTDSAGIVQIYNLALSRIGVAQTVSSITETSDSATQCNIWYPQCRDALLRDFTWPWAQAFAPLAQISTSGEWANAQWLFSYRYPANCLTARKVSVTRTNAALDNIPLTPVSSLSSYVYQAPGLREDGDPQPYPFAIGHDTDGRLIYCMIPNATLWYTMAVEDTTQFAPDFTSLLAWRLAKEIAYSLAVSDSRREYASKEYDRELRLTRANALNESQSDQPLIIMQSEVARARFGG